MSKEKFKLFLDDKKSTELAKKIKPSSGMVLIQMFMYRNSGLVMDEFGAAMNTKEKGQIETWPYAKVLNSKDYVTGAIVKLGSDYVSKATLNPAYEAIKANNDMYPMDYRDPGQKYTGGIVDLLKRYGFDLKPFKKQEDFVAIIPTHFIECEMDTELMLSE